MSACVYGLLQVGSGGMSSDMHELPYEAQETDLQKISKSYGIRDLSDESISESETNIQFEASNVNMTAGYCVSSTVLESFSVARDYSFCVPSEDLFSNFTCNQELQSQMTSANPVESQMLHSQDIPDGSVGTSSVHMDVNECSLSRRSMKQMAQQPLRTYTKVQKLGSVGRSINVMRFKYYHELRSAIASMFGLEGQIDDRKGSDWKLVYIDYENDVLLVGDDPWEIPGCIAPTDIEHEEDQFWDKLLRPVIEQHNQQQKFLQDARETLTEFERIIKLNGQFYIGVSLYYIFEAKDVRGCTKRAYQAQGGKEMEAKRTPRAVIVGGSITGLSCTHALITAGWGATLIKSPRPGPPAARQELALASTLSRDLHGHWVSDPKLVHDSTVYLTIDLVTDKTLLQEVKWIHVFKGGKDQR